jgi:transposase
MPRLTPAISLTLSPAQVQELEHIVRCGTSEQRLVTRAKLVLAHAQGDSLGAVQRKFKVSRNTVKLWCRRFALSGHAGLQDAPRSGKPPKHGKLLEQRVLEQLEQPVPVGRGRWTGKLLAQALEAPLSALAQGAAGQWHSPRAQTLLVRQPRS